MDHVPSAREKDTLLTRVASGEGVQVQALLLRRFRENKSGEGEPAGPNRTVTELWAAAGARKAEREKAEARRQREKRAREAAAYSKRLDELATRETAAWEQAAALINTKSPRDYDLAVKLLSDLRALADRQGDSAAFTRRFAELREQHMRKPSLLQRFDKAGLSGPNGDVDTVM